MPSKRLSDYTRVTSWGEDGIRIETRSGTGPGDHFGDEQVAIVSGDEIDGLVAFINEHIEGDET